MAPTLTFSGFPAHMQLMLVAARTHLREPELQQIRDLAARQPAEIDWNAFLAVTAHHRISPLVHESLEQVGSEGIPEFVRDELQRCSRLNAFLALRSAAELRRVISRFAESGFHLQPLKGVALSQILYGKPNMRHVGDLDLLTELLRLTDQIALFAELGYTLINPTVPLTPKRLTSYSRFWKDFTFRRDDGSELDLHWRLFNNRFHPANPLLSEASYTTITVFGTPMRVFSLEDQFLYCVAHGAYDSWTYLKTLADVSAFLRLFSPAQLDAALGRAAKIGLLPQASAAIHLANDWMGAGIANPKLLPADHPTSRHSRDRTSASLLAHDFKPDRTALSSAQWTRLELQLIPGMRSLAEVARRFACRPRLWAMVDLPDKLFWLYPILGLLLPPRLHPPDPNKKPLP